jgi:hypothetical protein
MNSQLFTPESVYEAERVVSKALRASILGDNNALNTALEEISERFSWCFSDIDSIIYLMGNDEDPLISRISAIGCQIKSIHLIAREPRINQ